MPHTRTNSAKHALKWMENQAEEGRNRVLFRGQRRVWSSIKPSITRDVPEIRDRMWDICSKFYSFSGAATGYHIKEGYHRLGVLQHYIRRSPVIDLTGTPKVALYFALQGDELGQERVVYSVNRDEAEVPSVVFTDHFFLVLPPGEGGFKSRWLKQDGYSVGPENWRNAEVVQNFDMLKLNGINCMRFVKQSDDVELVKDLGNLESVDDDPLAPKIRSAVHAMAKEGIETLSPGVERIFADTNLPDPDAALSEEIDCLMAKAKSRGRSDLTVRLEKIKKVSEGCYWDTSWDATLSSVNNELCGPHNS